MTAYVNIKAQSNANLNLKVRTQHKNLSVFNMLNYKADMEIRERKSGFVVLATLSSHQDADGTITISPEQGIYTLNLAPDILLNKIKVGTWYYDIILTRPDGVQFRHLEGNFIVDGSTTINMTSENE